MEKSLDILEDWEEWNPESGTSFFVHALAGSLAGAAEHCAMFPFDTIKTYAQAAKSNSGSYNLSETLRALRTANPNVSSAGSLQEVFGVLRLWRGVSTMLAACIPAHAAYFSIFEQGKVILNVDNGEHTPIAAAMCGISATIAHDMIMTPMDVIKQRLQLGFHSGPLDCARTLIRTEGAKSLYLSFPTTLFMNIPYAAIMVATNESAKLVLNPRNEYNVPAFIVSGAFAGGVAAAITNPLDVVKTRLQTQNLLNTYPNCHNLTPVSSEIVVSETEVGLSNIIRSSSNTSKPSSNMTSFFDRFKYSRDAIGFGRGDNFGYGLNQGLGVRHTYTLSGKFPGKTLCFPYQYCPPSQAQPQRRGTITLRNPAADGSKLRMKGTTAGNTIINTKPAADLDCLCHEIPVKPEAGDSATQMRMQNRFRYKGFLDAVGKIYAEEGYLGFSRGLTSRLMVHMPSVAISWTTYETAKKALSSLR